MHNFQSLPNADIKDADVAILPLCFEKTVCGKKGTKNAPLSIIESSMELEFYDEVMDISPFKYIDIYTEQSFNEIVDFVELEKKVKSFSKKILPNTLLLTLGGEHSITPFVAKHFLKKETSIVIFDAHADFRKSYIGEANNHACAVYNLYKLGFKDIILIGVRSFFEDEKKRLKKAGIKLFDDLSLQDKKVKKELNEVLKSLKGDVYISVDMDGFDPSLVSGVGTPQPGGFSWHFFLDALKRIVLNEKVNLKGLDIVELIPEESLVSQIVAAKILQKTISFWCVKEKLHKKTPNGAQTKISYE